MRLSPKRCILLSGFQPFGGRAVNVSAVLVAQLRGAVLEGYRIETVVLPVEYGRAFAKLSGRIRALRPAAVVSFGQGRGEKIAVERYARAMDRSCLMPDERRRLPDASRRGVIAGGPWKSGLPVVKIARRLAAAGIPARVSGNAGNYVCNWLFLQSVRHARGSYPAGFIHLPPEGRLARMPALKRVGRIVAASVLESLPR